MSQTVYRLTSRTGFQALQPFTEPIPTARPHELLVKVKSVSLNFRDIAIATSKYPPAAPLKENVVPCSDMAGEVVALGEDVDPSLWRIGDAIVSPNDQTLMYGVVQDMLHALGGPIDGVLSEYVVVPAYSAIKIPASLGTGNSDGVQRDFSQWAASVSTLSTVWNCFYGNTPLKPGDTVLILGTGGVSLTALVIAKAAGATAIITSSSDNKLSHVKTVHGADHTINYNTTPDWSVEVLRITNGRGADHVIEVGGPGTIAQSLASVARGGIVSNVGYLAPDGDASGGGNQPDILMLTLIQAATLRGILAGSKQQLEEGIRFLASRGLAVPVDRVFKFEREDIVAAFEYVASGKHLGKVCINL